MREVEIDKNQVPHCPFCGAKQTKTENRWCYGSPVRKCDKCGNEFLDRRFTELAISGIPENQLSVKRGVMGMLWGLAFVLAGFLLSLMAGSWTIKSSVISIGGGLMALCFLADMISILTGNKLKKFEEIKNLSEERLSDHNYAKTLAELGYNVPEKFLH